MSFEDSKHFDGRVEEKEKPSRVILELGAGHKNYFRELNIAMRPDDLYISLDLNTNKISSSRGTARDVLAKAEGVNADAQLLPLADKSVDQVIFSDILNAPILSYGKGGMTSDFHNKAYNSSKEQLEQASRFQTEEQRQAFLLSDNILNEGQRALKDNGRILLIDTKGWAYPEVYKYLIQKLRQSDKFEFRLRDDLLAEVPPERKGGESSIYELIKKPSR